MGLCSQTDEAAGAFQAGGGGQHCSSFLPQTPFSVQSPQRPDKISVCCCIVLGAVLTVLPVRAAITIMRISRDKLRQHVDPALSHRQVLAPMMILFSTDFALKFCTTEIHVIFCDRTSQYQIVAYITYWKGQSVISSGLLMTAIGVINYFSCVDHAGPEHTIGHAACDDSAIATYPLFWLVVLLWLASNSLIWLMFGNLIAMHHANQGVDGSPVEGESETAAAQRKLRLERTRALHSRTRFWRNYDVATFLVAVAAGAAIGFQGSVLEDLGTTVESSGSGTVDWIDETRLGLRGEWELRQLVFWCHVLHSLLSLPFLLFTLPLFHLVFTSEPVTGYTREGHCVALAKAVGAESSEVVPSSLLAQDDAEDEGP